MQVGGFDPHLNAILREFCFLVFVSLSPENFMTFWEQTTWNGPDMQIGTENKWIWRFFKKKIGMWWNVATESNVSTKFKYFTAEIKF